MSTLPQLPTRPLSAPAAQQEKLDNQRFAMYVTNYVQATEERPACLTTAEGAAIVRKYSTGGGRLAALTALVNARLAYWQSTKGYQPETTGGALAKPLTPEQVQEAREFFAQVPPVLADPAPAPMTPPVAKSTVPTNGNGSTLRQAQGASESPAPSFEAQRSPATWSVDYLDVDGWPCTLAITAASGNEAVARGRQIVKALKGQGAKPRVAVAPVAAQGAAAASTKSGGEAPKCKYHGVPMKHSDKHGGFYCTKKISGGGYCDYKVDA